MANIKSKRSGNAVEFRLRVLGYKTKGGEWAAHCLETDLVGYGKTFQSAISDLMELTEMQVSFALQMKQPALLDRPAPPEIFETYNISFRSQLQSFPLRPRTSDKHKVASIPMPNNLGKSNFCVVSA